MGSIELDLLYKPVEVADVLKISKSKAYELIAAGEIESIRVGSLLRVPRHALVGYIDGLSRARTA